MGVGGRRRAEPDQGQAALLAARAAIVVVIVVSRHRVSFGIINVLHGVAAPSGISVRAIAFKFALAPQCSVLNRNDAAHPAEHLAIGPYEPATAISTYNKNAIHDALLSHDVLGLGLPMP